MRARHPQPDQFPVDRLGFARLTPLIASAAPRLAPLIASAAPRLAPLSPMVTPTSAVPRGTYHVYSELSYELCVTPSVRVTKRAIDIGASLFGLAVTAPLYPLIAAAIKIEDPGPIFYQQRRAGMLKRMADVGGIPTPEFVEFKMSKFRSMRVDAEKFTGAVLAQENDPRITRVGKFLRKTRLDEIPQFWNVLEGEMSLIGPRPGARRSCSSTLALAIPFFEERGCATSSPVHPRASPRSPSATAAAPRVAQRGRRASRPPSPTPSVPKRPRAPRPTTCAWEAPLRSGVLRRAGELLDLPPDRAHRDREDPARDGSSASASLGRPAQRAGAPSGEGDQRKRGAGVGAVAVEGGGHQARSGPAP